MTPPLLSVKDLTVAPRKGGGRSILRGIDLEVHPGDRVGLIGESGSGKTTVVRALIGLLDGNLAMEAGTVEFKGSVVRDGTVDHLAGLRGRHLGMIFQSALASLNPLRRLGSQLHEILRVHRRDLDRAGRTRLLHDLLERMGLSDVDRLMRSYPSQVSGGQRQRIAIALALAPSPEVVIADECTSALDVGSQAMVVDLLASAVDDERALLFVTHDLLLAAELCNRIVVLRHGEIVEEGPSERILEAPEQPYTRALLASLPPWAPADGSWPPVLVPAGEGPIAAGGPGGR